MREGGHGVGEGDCGDGGREEAEGPLLPGKEQEGGDGMGLGREVMKTNLSKCPRKYWPNSVGACRPCFPL